MPVCAFQIVIFNSQMPARTIRMHFSGLQMPVQINPMHINIFQMGIHFIRMHAVSNIFEYKSDPA